MAISSDHSGTSAASLNFGLPASPAASGTTAAAPVNPPSSVPVESSSWGEYTFGGLPVQRAPCSKHDQGASSLDVFGWLVELAGDANVQVIEERTSEGQEVRGIHPTSLSVWNMETLFPDEDEDVLCRIRVQFPHSDEKEHRKKPVLLPFEGILLSLLLNHHEGTRHDVALAVRFAWSLAQAAAVQKLRILFSKKASFFPNQRCAYHTWNQLPYRVARPGSARFGPGTAFVVGGNVLEHLQRMSGATPEEVLLLCMFGFLPPKDLLQAEGGLINATTGCLCGEQLDICRILLDQCGKKGQLQAATTDIPAITQFFENCPLFHPPGTPEAQTVSPPT